MRTIEFKLYPTLAQERTLSEWLRVSCWTYNRALEHRIKAYKRRKESPSYYSQCAMVTKWRSRMPRLKACPRIFLTDALRRVDLGMKAFFRRIKSGEKPGFPRFRSRHRFNSLGCIEPGQVYVRGGQCAVPKLGIVRCRSGHQHIPSGQRLFRVIRRAAGWFGQVLVDDAPLTSTEPQESSVGIDVGLTQFATLSTGKTIDNPRWLRRSARKLRAVQRRASRKQKGSRNRRKAINRLARVHERIAAQRKDFCHQQSRKIVDRFGLIGFEKLNIRGLARMRLAKSVLDAAWGMFIRFTTYKAENAGRQVVMVDARGTSQECPWCGRVLKKELSERTHWCTCGLALDRDHAAAMVIHSRALASRRGVTPVEIEALADELLASAKLRSMKQEGLVSRTSPLLPPPEVR